MVPTDSCHLLSEPMQETLDRARKFLTSLGRDTAAAVHHVIVRESQANGEQLVVFAAIHNDESLRRALARFHAKQVKTVAFTEQDRVDGPVWGHKVDVLKGDGQLMEEIGGIQFRVSPRSFLQVQTDMASRLYDIVLDYAQIRPEDTVVDAYCGIGTMTLMLAQGAKRAIGIEEIASAVDDAKANAVRNRVTNAEFHRGRVEAWLPQWVQSGARPSTIVFDPPRKGIDGPALRAAIQAKIPRIVYASCNPATLRRDLQILLTNGYEIAAIQPMDMFPQTSHVETVVKLVRG
jgi:23S rRNA (uracil1939-C5)-methyltransferase